MEVEYKVITANSYYQLCSSTAVSLYFRWRMAIPRRYVDRDEALHHLDEDDNDSGDNSLTESADLDGGAFLHDGDGDPRGNIVFLSFALCSTIVTLVDDAMHEGEIAEPSVLDPVEAWNFEWERDDNSPKLSGFENLLLVQQSALDIDRHLRLCFMRHSEILHPICRVKELPILSHQSPILYLIQMFRSLMKLLHTMSPRIVINSRLSFCCFSRNRRILLLLQRFVWQKGA